MLVSLIMPVRGALVRALWMCHQPTQTPDSGLRDASGPPVGQTLTMLVLSVALTCVVVRWLLPFVLHSITEPIQDGIAVLAGLMLLPEYILTTIMRRMGKSPLRISYDFGDVVVWIARTLRVTVRIVFDGAARACYSIPPTVVAIISGGLALAHTLGQL
jgi:hypothetical protein